MDEDDTDELRSSLMFAASGYYKQWKPWLRRILKLSRYRRLLRSPDNFLVLQLAMYDALFLIEGAIQRQKKQHELSKASRHVVYNLRLRQIIKDIADGVAWRTLGFNRPLMRVLSQNRSPGYLSNSTGREDTAAKRIGAQGALVMIHDVTNVLRIGDLTVIDQNGPQVIELKREGRKVLTADDYRRILRRGQGLSVQASRVVELDEVIRTGKLTVGETPVSLGVVDFPVATYHSEVGEIIEEASRTGMSERFLDRLLYIRAFRIDTKTGLKLPFHLRDHWHRTCNVDTFLPPQGHFVRNKVPYSTFPFRDEIVLQLITGELIIESYLNVVALKKRFQKAGWRVKDHSREFEAAWPDFQESTEAMFTGPKLFNLDTTVTLFTLSRGAYHSAVTPEHLGMIVFDFLKPEIITDTAEAMMRLTAPTRTDGAFGIAYSAESKIWR